MPTLHLLKKKKNPATGFTILSPMMFFMFAIFVSLSFSSMASKLGNQHRVPMFDLGDDIIFDPWHPWYL